MSSISRIAAARRALAITRLRVDPRRDARQSPPVRRPPTPRSDRRSRGLFSRPSFSSAVPRVRCRSPSRTESVAVAVDRDRVVHETVHEVTTQAAFGKVVGQIGEQIARRADDDVMTGVEARSARFRRSIVLPTPFGLRRTTFAPSAVKARRASSHSGYSIRRCSAAWRLMTEDVASTNSGGSRRMILPLACAACSRAAGTLCTPLGDVPSVAGWPGRS